MHQSKVSYNRCLPTARCEIVVPKLQTCCRLTGQLHWLGHIAVCLRSYVALTDGLFPSAFYNEGLKPNVVNLRNEVVRLHRSAPLPTGRQAYRALCWSNLYVGLTPYAIDKALSELTIS